MKKAKKFLLLAIVTALIAGTLAFTASATTRLWPVPGHKATSRRYYIGSSPETSHYGLDITDGSISGATVVAAMGGYVTNKYTCNENHYPNIPSCCYGFGNGVIIKGDDGLYYQYAHMQEGSIPGNVYVGAYVSIGSKVGAVGNTGNSSGAHLHFQMSTATPMNSYSVNPDNYVFSDSLSWKTSASKVNLGDSFYARIVNTAMNKPLTVQDDGNVVIYDRNNSKNQIWKFTKNSDGSYAIVSLYNNKSLDVYGAYNSASTNLQTYEYHGGVAQQWGIYGSEGNYFLSAACTDCVVDVSGANPENGTNVVMYTKNDSIAQLYTIEKIAAPSKPVLVTSASGKNTTFLWSKDSKASSYDLKIMKDGSIYKSISSVPYKTVERSKNVTYTLSLPNGIYTAVLTAKNLAGNTASNTISIIVNNNPDSSGWMYATSLPSGITSKNYKIEYAPTYTKVAKTSPGSEWVKGSVAKQEYENSGDVYYSNFPLETSAARELVNTSYYHWCSGSNHHVNFAQTSTYSHYDGMNNANVYEESAHTDADDSRYTYYVLKYKDSGAYAYCQSGVTCDGAYGSHGNRSYYWYKTYAYQDKAAVDYYNFTKQGDWSETKDSSASSYVVRYKAIGHSYTTKVTKATLTANGKITTVCSICGNVKSTKAISAPKTFTLSTTSYTYNGAVKTPTVTVKDAAGNVLKKDTDYTVSYASGRKNAGTYNVTVKMKGNYSGTKTLSFKIKPIDISDCTVKLSNTSYTFNGTVRTPTVTVKNSYGVTLTKDKSYTVIYASGRRYIGKYNVIVTMKGNYTGTKTLSFNIKPIDISTCKVTLSSTNYTYNGYVKTPKVTVVNSYGQKLMESANYTLTYSEGRTAPGTYSVTVKMKGNYTGTKTLSFKIKPIDISTCTVKLSGTAYTFNGTVRTPTVTVTNSYGTKLTNGTHYTVSYASGRKNAGTYNVTVKMKGNYTGTKTLSFKINPINISTCTVKLSATSLTYNGEIRTPDVSVTNSYGQKLTFGTHYSVIYSSGRKNVGTYNVTVKMKGNYTGTKTLTFRINPPKTTVASLVRGTKAITVNVSKQAVQTTGYQIQYATNKSFTNAKTVTIANNTTLKATLRNLNAATTYYVRVRTYKTASNATYYSAWSAYKYVKTK